MTIENNTVVVFDGNYIGNMTKWAFEGLSHDEQQTGVVFGFMQEILKRAKQFSTNRFVFCWDDWRESLRRQIYSDYKISRRLKRDLLTDEEVQYNKLATEQFSILYQEVLPLFGFENNYLLSGLEGDDLIASVVMSNKGLNFVVIATDADLYQLLDYCKMYSPIKGKLFDAEWLLREHNVTPTEWIIVKVIAGCKGDDIRGMPGVGEKTAVKYIRSQLKKDSKIYKRITEMKQAIYKQNLSLIKLPYARTPTLLLKPDKPFLADNFLDICRKYDFRLFQREYAEWNKIFHFK
jgi:DNA polymerase-1